MNNIIQPDWDKIIDMFPYRQSEEFDVLRKNLMIYFFEILNVMSKNYPTPKAVFKRKKSHSKWLQANRDDPSFTILYSGEWLKVYKLRNNYYLAQSPLTWTSADSKIRFDD